MYFTQVNINSLFPKNDKIITIKRKQQIKQSSMKLSYQINQITTTY